MRLKLLLAAFLLACTNIASAAAFPPPSVALPAHKSVLDNPSALKVKWTTATYTMEAESADTFDLFVHDAKSDNVVWRNKTIARTSHCDASGNCEIDIAVMLNESKNHFLRIRSENSLGKTAWSKRRYFHVLDLQKQPPKLPEVLSPEQQGIVSLGVPIELTFQLAPSDDSSHDPDAFDFLVYDRQANSVVSRLRNVQNVSCDASRKCTYHIPNELTEGRKLVLKIRARNAAGASAWSQSRRFSVVNPNQIVPSVPVITYPSAGQEFDTSQSLNFQWRSEVASTALDAASDFDAYIYDLDSGSLIWRDRSLKSTVCDNNGNCSITIPVNAPIGDGYFFKIKAKNLLGSSPWSRRNYFRVTQHQPLVVYDSCTEATDATLSFSGDLRSMVEGGEEPYTFELLSDPARGIVDLNYNSGSFVFYPADNGRGFLDGFDVRVRDNNAEESIAHVSFVFGIPRIMPVGDSITFGVENYNSTTGDFPLSANAVGYRKRLKELLDTGGYTVDLVGPRNSGYSAGLGDSQHAGFPGWTSTHIAYGRSGHAASGHLSQWLNNHPADVLLIHAGTNDHSSSAYGIGQILAKAQAWRAANNNPLLSMTASLIDQRRDYWNRDHLAAFNSALASEVAAVSSARLVDMFSVLDWQDDLTSYPTDITGLHPNGGGYQKMAEKWYQSLVGEGVVNKCY